MQFISFIDIICTAGEQTACNVDKDSARSVRALSCDEMVRKLETKNGGAPLT